MPTTLGELTKRPIDQRFIDIEETADLAARASEGARCSAFQIEKSGRLRVLGALPHNYEFAPATRTDALKLAEYFAAIAEYLPTERDDNG